MGLARDESGAGHVTVGSEVSQASFNNVYTRGVPRLSSYPEREAQSFVGEGAHHNTPRRVLRGYRNCEVVLQIKHPSPPGPPNCAIGSNFVSRKRALFRGAQNVGKVIIRPNRMSGGDAGIVGLSWLIRLSTRELRRGQ